MVKATRNIQQVERAASQARHLQETLSSMYKEDSDNNIKLTIVRVEGIAAHYTRKEINSRMGWYPMIEESFKTLYMNKTSQQRQRCQQTCETQYRQCKNYYTTKKQQTLHTQLTTTKKKDKHNRKIKKTTGLDNKQSTIFIHHHSHLHKLPKARVQDQAPASPMFELETTDPGLPRIKRQP